MGSVGAVATGWPGCGHASGGWTMVVRAQQRYDTAKGDFCAAAVTYFTIFAMFPLLMVGFAVGDSCWPAGRPCWQRSTAG